MMAKQLLETYFKKEEIPEVQRKIEKDKNFKETFDKVKKKQVDISLDNLQAKVNKTQDSFEKRFEEFKKAIIEAEKKQKSGVVDTLKDKATKTLEEKKKELDKKLKEQANKKIPFVGDFLYDWAKGLTESTNESGGFFDKIFGKIGKYIGMAILGFLGLKKGFEQMQNLKGDKTEGKEDEKKKAEEGEEDGADEKVSESFYYHSGLDTLLYFAGIESGVDSKKSMDKFKTKSFKELREIKNSGKIDGKKITKEDKKVLESLLNSDTRILLKSSLKKNIVKETLKNNELKLKKLLGKEYDIILDNINNNTFKIEDLSLNAISILSLFSIKSFGLLTIKGIGDNFKKVFDFFGDDSIDMEKIKADLNEKKSGILSKKFLETLNKKHKILNHKVTTSDEEFKKDFEDFENKEELEKFLNFKNWLLGNEFLGDNSKSLLKKFGKSEAFRDNLTYAGVIALYTIFAGKTSFENLGVIDLSATYKLLSVIIGRKEPAYASDYIRNVISYLADSDSKEIFKDSDDKEALKIIGERLGTTYLKFLYREIKKKLGWFGLFNDKIENDAIAILGGYGLTKAGGKMMKKGFVFKGAFLKKIGYLAVISGIASAINTTYNNGSELFNELSGFKDKDPSKIPESELENLGKQAEELNKRIITKEIVLDGEPKKIGLFEAKTGLEIFYEGKIYKFGVGFRRFGDEENGIKNLVSNIMNSNALNFIKQELPSEYQKELEKWEKENLNNFSLEFKGTKYDFSKVKVNGDKIYIGEKPNILKLNLDSFLKQVVKSKEEHPIKVFDIDKKEKNKSITYKIIEKGDDDEHNLILIQQGVLKS